MFFVLILMGQDSKINSITYVQEVIIKDQYLQDNFLNVQDKDAASQQLSEEDKKEKYETSLKLLKKLTDPSKSQFTFDHNNVIRRVSPYPLNAIEYFDLQNKTQSSYCKRPADGKVVASHDELFGYDSLYTDLKVKMDDLPSDKKTIVGYECYKRIIEVSYSYNQNKHQRIYEMYITNDLDLPINIVLMENFKGFDVCALEVNIIDKNKLDSYVSLRANKVEKNLPSEVLLLPEEYRKEEYKK
jgi:hypothetical protein